MCDKKKDYKPTLKNWITWEALKRVDSISCAFQEFKNQVCQLKTKIIMWISVWFQG